MFRRITIIITAVLAWCLLPAHAQQATPSQATNAVMSVIIPFLLEDTPSVVLTAQTDRSIARVNLTAVVKDAEASIVNMQFYQGDALIGSVTTAPYTFAWNEVPEGQYTLKARATDSTGRVIWSNAVAVNTVNVRPTVHITSPADMPFNPNAPPSAPLFNPITLSAAASDSDGTISMVQFYTNSTTLIATVSQPPYNFTWTEAPAGVHILTATATDDLGGKSTSAPVRIAVGNAPPTVTMTASATNLQAPATFTLTAIASDQDGRISKVEFYDGYALLGSTTVTPYTMTWSNVPAGTYSLTAKATDNLGGTNWSFPLAVTVITPPQSPLQAYDIETDHLSTPRRIADQNSNVVWQWENTDPFGNNAPTSGAGFEFNLRFPGQYFDKETGLHYNYFRDYDPSTGRYVQSDPTGLRGGLNTYAYVEGNPLRNVDPLGLLTVYIWNYRGSQVAWGHASMTLRDGTHISWWPSGNNRATSLPGVPIYSAPANQNQTFGRDIHLEGQSPDQQIEIEGLDEAAIKQWWDSFKANNQWKTLGQNCSTTVADGLTAGGGRSFGFLGGLIPANFVWTPSDAANYANSINKGMARWRYLTK